MFVGDNMTIAEGLADIAASATEVWNPVGGAGSLLQQLTPTVLRPAVELSINKDFSGKPIYPTDNPFGVPKPDHMKYFQSVNPASKAVTDGLNELFGGNDVRGAGAMSVSPETLDYMLNFALGSAGTFAQKFATFPFAVAGKAREGELFPANNVPGFRRFFGHSTDTEIPGYPGNQALLAKLVNSDAFASDRGESEAALEAIRDD